MVKYIIFLQQLEAEQFIQQINICMGYPNSTGTERYAIVDVICTQDEITKEWVESGFGVEIKDYILDCLDETQKENIIILDDTIVFCDSLPSNDVVTIEP